MNTKFYYRLAIIFLALFSLTVFSSCIANNSLDFELSHENTGSHIDNGDGTFTWKDNREDEIMDFIPDSINVTLKPEYSQVNREIKLDNFGINHREVGLGAIRDRTHLDNPETALIDWKYFVQMLSIELEENFRSREGIVNAIRELEKSPMVRRVQPACTGVGVPVGITLSTVPALRTASNDEYFDLQWGLQRINIEQAWSYVTTNYQLRVGLMDGGLRDSNNPNWSHPDLNVSPLSFGRHIWLMHGVAVGGVLGAVRNNLTGISGAANVSLVHFDWVENKFVDHIMRAADSGIAIINCSFIFHRISSGWAPYNEDHADAIRMYSGLIVVAAGNDGDYTDISERYPAGYSNASNPKVDSIVANKVISVGASDENDERALFIVRGSSNYGRNSVSLFAPGTNILTTFPTVGQHAERCRNTNCYIEGSVHFSLGYHHTEGSSLASPYVSGAASLLRTKYTLMDGPALKANILESVDKIPAKLVNLCATEGRLNAAKIFENLFGGGTGTQNDPYLIKDARHFRNMYYYGYNNNDKYYKMTNNINLSN